MIATIAFLVVFVAVVGIIFYLNARQNKAMETIAQKNGWQPVGLDDASLGNYVPSYLRSKPDSTNHKYRMAYQAQIDGQSIVFFRYEETIRKTNGFNNNDVTGTSSPEQFHDISYAIGAFGVPRTFGQILILHHGRLDNVGLHNGLQKFTLEGDFNQYFDVYAPQGSSIETLSVLTPDVMAYLIDLGQKYHWNIEINGNLVIVEGDADLISPDKISILLDYSKSLRQKLAAKPNPTGQVS